MKEKNEQLKFTKIKNLDSFSFYLLDLLDLSSGEISQPGY